MDTKAIEKIIQLFEKSTVAELEYEAGDFKLKLKKTSSGISLVNDTKESVAIVSNDQDWLVAPIVGTFYLAANPQSKPYVEIGQVVKEGDVVCLIEAMKVMNEVKAHQSGTITEIMAVNSKMVEYNQKLICIKA